jgi:division/cell wall cluster transcriptional repressor MraZ
MINFFNEKSFISVDPKGRLLLPKDIRESVGIDKGDKVVLLPSRTTSPYLEVRTIAQWQAYLEGLRKNEANAETKNTLRYAKLMKEEMKVDGTGRVLLPQRIRDACNLHEQVAVIDMESYIEVWCRMYVEQRYAEWVEAFKNTNDRML